MIMMVSWSNELFSQNRPIIRKAVYHDKTPPLREMQVVVPGVRDRSWKEQ